MPTTSSQIIDESLPSSPSSSFKRLVNHDVGTTPQRSSGPAVRPPDPPLPLKLADPARLPPCQTVNPLDIPELRSVIFSFVPLNASFDPAVLGISRAFYNGLHARFYRVLDLAAFARRSAFVRACDAHDPLLVVGRIDELRVGIPLADERAIPAVQHGPTLLARLCDYLERYPTLAAGIDVVDIDFPGPSPTAPTPEGSAGPSGPGPAALGARVSQKAASIRRLLDVREDVVRLQRLTRKETTVRLRGAHVVQVGSIADALADLKSRPGGGAVTLELPAYAFSTRCARISCRRLRVPSARGSQPTRTKSRRRPARPCRPSFLAGSSAGGETSGHPSSCSSSLARPSSTCWPRPTSARASGHSRSGSRTRRRTGSACASASRARTTSGSQRACGRASRRISEGSGWTKSCAGGWRASGSEWASAAGVRELKRCA